ncbi:uncharacterized protein LOC120631960 [Pararge aegeria]|uniref:Jg13537 protein n=1 Tax=Pararge aegeria aegeria TaxID=348720 RepID=A0A8S4S9H2_9NEOP|nr:uncharacterized protein LOC120631960 [Pararge aegeria]CAH2252990.1 jg13537 [Pararge aegeria aegeria]
MQPTSALALIPFLVLIVLAQARPDAEENVDSGPPCLGCEVDQDSNKSLYKNMAEESILKYLRDNNFDKYHKIIKITKATQQVVAGYMYRIDFDAYPTNCDLESDEDTSTCEVMDTSKYLKCHSEIWDRAWLDQKQIKVTCEDKRREKRQITGGVKEQDPKNPVYADLATESLALYAKDKGLSGSHEVVEVTKATTQVVAGYLTHVYFNALIGSSNPVTCHSVVLEQAWLNVKNITVTCDLIEEKQNNPGGDQEKDKYDPIY